MTLYSSITDGGFSFIIVIGLVVLVCNTYGTVDVTSSTSSVPNGTDDVNVISAVPKGSLVRNKRFHSHHNKGVSRTKTCGNNSTDDDCPMGYYGKECRLQCHCAEGDICGQDGYCVENEMDCARGWFDDKCQHVDIAYNGKEYFADGDPETCSEDVNIKGIFQKLRRPVMFTFLRLVVMEDESFRDEINLSFVRTDGSDVGCDNGSSFMETDDSLNVYCYDVGRVTHVNLRWKGQRNVCSLHVDGGRNLAFSRHSDRSERKAVDGDLSTRPEDCWSKTGDAKPSWHVDFEGSIYLYLIIITGRPDHVGNRMRGFMLSLYDENDKKVYTYHDSPLDNAPENKFSIEINPLLIITKAEISFNTTKVPNPELHICEFEAYGDCANTFFGDTCENVCPYNCGDDKCDIEGHCYFCKDGFSGDECATWDNYTSFEFYEDMTTTQWDTTTTPSGSSTSAPETDDVMDLVFLCLHVVFGTTIVTVIMAFALLRIRDYKSARGSTVYSLAPSTMSGSIMSPKRSQKSIHPTETLTFPTQSQSKTMTYSTLTTTNQ